MQVAKDIVEVCEWQWNLQCFLSLYVGLVMKKTSSYFFGNDMLVHLPLHLL